MHISLVLLIFAGYSQCGKLSDVAYAISIWILLDQRIIASEMGKDFFPSGIVDDMIPGKM